MPVGADGRRVPLPPPALADGLSAAAQQAALEALPGRTVPVEELVRASVVAPGLGSERARQVADGLVAQAWFETRARGYLVMAAIASSRLTERYRAIGLDVEVIGRLGDRNALRLDPSIG